MVKAIFFSKYNVTLAKVFNIILMILFSSSIFLIFYFFYPLVTILTTFTLIGLLLLLILYDVFYIFLLPFFVIRIFYSNDLPEIAWSQKEYINSVGRNKFKLLRIYISTTYFRNQDISLNEEYKKVVPLCMYMGILNLEKQKKTLSL